MTLVVSYSKGSLVLGAVVIAVADERALPVVVEICVRDSDVVCRMSDIKEAIIIILRSPPQTRKHIIR